MTALTATIDLPDVTQPFEWGDFAKGLNVRPTYVINPGVLLIIWAPNDEAAMARLPTDDARELAAHIWAAAEAADAKAKP